MSWQKHYDAYMDVPYTKEPEPIGQDAVDDTDIYESDDYFEIGEDLVLWDNLYEYAATIWTFHKGGLL